MICRNCVMDSSDPDIKFFDKVCNHCNEYRVKEKKRKIEMTNRPWIIHRMKKGNVLLGLSGGADSSTCLHLLLEQGIRPITFSLDNGWEDKNANENVRKLVEKTGVHHELIRIDVPKFRKLQEAFMKSGVPNIEIPTDHILFALTYQMARKFKCKYVVSGGNLATESIMPKSWGYDAKDLTHIKDIAKKFGATTKGLPTLSLFGYIWNRFVRGIKIVNLLDYYDYNRENSMKILEEKYDWKSYGDKHEENPFTQWFQNYFLPMRWGIDKRKAHYSSLILSGQMTRDEALRKLRESAPYTEMKFEIGDRKSHFAYKTSKYWWELLAKIYHLFHAV